MLAQGVGEPGFEVYCPRYSRNVRHARSVKRSILALPAVSFRPHRFDLPRWRSINGSRGLLYHHNE